MLQSRHISRTFGAALLAACATALPARAVVVAHWSFDDPDSGSNYADSEFAHPATPVDRAAVTSYAGNPPAPFGKAVAFNGTPNAYLTIPPITTIQKSSLTVAAWVKVSTPQNFILTDWQSERTSGFIFGLDPQGNDKSKAQPLIELKSTENKASNGSTKRAVNRLGLLKTVPFNEWHHLAWTWDRDSTTISTYLDGEMIGDRKKPPTTDTNFSKTLDVAINQRPMRIGSRELNNGTAPGTPTAFNGAMDELWVFDQALTPIQIRNLIKTNDIGGNASPIASPAPTVDPTPPTPTVPVEPSVSEAPAARTPVLSSTGKSSLSPARVMGIVACLTIIVSMACYLIWAVTERAKLRASRS